MVVKGLSDVIDIWDETSPNRTSVFRWHSEGNHAIKLRSKQIGVFVSTEELLKGIFLFCVEYELFFTNIPENLVIQ